MISTDLVSLQGERLKTSALQQLLVDIRPRLSLALGMPAPDLLPCEQLQEAASRAFLSGASALQYAPPLDELKDHIVDIMSWRGVRCRSSQVFLTTGAQQGLSLLSKLLLLSRKTLICEDLAYTGFQQAIAPMAADVVTVSSDPVEGIDVGEVAGRLRDGWQPSFIYIMSDGHNPLGVSLSAVRRQQLVDLATQFSVPIVEDDTYGLLDYDLAPYGPVKALNDDHVFYISSFSKIVSPAMRIGWVIVPEWLTQALGVLKEGSDINTATFTQHVLCAYLQGGHLWSQVLRLRQEYRRRRDVMNTTLERTFPHSARWTVPSHGVYFWVELAEPYDTTDLLSRTLKSEGVAFVPGAAFAVGTKRRSNALRLNFSYCDSSQIEEAIERIALHL